MAEAKAKAGADFLAVGRLLRPWGLDGALVVQSLTDDVGRFARLGEVWLKRDQGRVSARVTACRPQGAHTLLWFDCAPTRTEAEGLVGATVEVSLDQAEPLPSGSYYRHDLVGLRVLTVAGAELGRVVSILETGAADVLVVGDDAGAEVLLPAARNVVVDVDLVTGVLTVDPPEGLIELNRRAVKAAG